MIEITVETATPNGKSIEETLWIQIRLHSLSTMTIEREERNELLCG